MTSTGLFVPELNDTCTSQKNRQSCQYRGNQIIKNEKAVLKFEIIYLTINIKNNFLILMKLGKVV